MEQPVSNPALGWSAVAIATLTLILISGIILYPDTNATNILTALRVSALTTALTFLLVFVATPLVRWAGGQGVGRGLGLWAQANRPYLWAVATLSHLIHLGQIGLFYQLGQSCPLLIWAVTSPLWLILLGILAIEIGQPQRLAGLYDPAVASGLKWLHGLGSIYVWLVFTLAFGMSAAVKHLPFYNGPLLVLFLAAAVLYGLTFRKAEGQRD